MEELILWNTSQSKANPYSNTSVVVAEIDRISIFRIARFAREWKNECEWVSQVVDVAGICAYYPCHGKLVPLCTTTTFYFSAPFGAGLNRIMSPTSKHVGALVLRFMSGEERRALLWALVSYCIEECGRETGLQATSGASYYTVCRVAYHIFFI